MTITAIDRRAARRVLGRRLLGEFVGTALLLATIVGAGIMAASRSPGDPGLQLLEAALATGLVLSALIVALGPVSGAHFNPAVSLADRLLGGMGWGLVGSYTAVQVAGGAVGAMVANIMFDRSVVSVATTSRGGLGQLVGEAVATFGLVLVIFSMVRARMATGAIAAAVGAFIAGAHWFTSSTSFANPAVTVARMLSDSFAGIAPASAGPFVLAQLVGTALAIGTVRLLHPDDLPSAT